MVQHKLDSSGRAAVTCKEGGGGGTKQCKTRSKAATKKEMSGQANTSRAGRDERQWRGWEEEEEEWGWGGWKIKGVTR